MFYLRTYVPVKWRQSDRQVCPVVWYVPAVSDTAVDLDLSPRQRIQDSAYVLFSHRGIGAVGINEIIDAAGVAKATLYRHFASKDELVLDFLERREQAWTREWLEAEARRRGSTPEEQLLAIFDVFSEWFVREDFEGCTFINVLLETTDRESAVRRACTIYLGRIRTIVRTLAEEAGFREPEAFAHSWHILMKGSIVAAAEGDVEAGRRAQAMARSLIEQYR